jgi:hypothetical protein
LLGCFNNVKKMPMSSRFTKLIIPKYFFILFVKLFVVFYIYFTFLLRDSSRKKRLNILLFSDELPVWPSPVRLVPEMSAIIEFMTKSFSFFYHETLWPFTRHNNARSLSTHFPTTSTFEYSLLYVYR